VHHSSLVLNPLSNYREHPLDNLFYALVVSAGVGVATGSLLTIFGVVPTEMMIIGVAVPTFFFNTLGYHLRHSHVWVRWPDPFAVLFGSPAHHQIHHSCKPEHIDKNLAFMFPIWDWIFGTYHLPKERPELDIGLGDGSESEYSSFLRIYALPFVRLFSTQSGHESAATPVLPERH
jgi:sterol desaturase/sphingolipid hydroxylase (fatty acid hydroxylase superfamily)